MADVSISAYPLTSGRQTVTPRIDDQLTPIPGSLPNFHNAALNRENINRNNNLSKIKNAI